MLTSGRDLPYYLVGRNLNWLLMGRVAPPVMNGMCLGLWENLNSLMDLGKQGKKPFFSAIHNCLRSLGVSGYMQMQGRGAGRRKENTCESQLGQRSATKYNDNGFIILKR